MWLEDIPFNKNTPPNPTSEELILQEKPTHLPCTQWNGSPLKPLTDVVLERRATAHFKPDPVPETFLNAILQLGSQAPSGYNLQPWRFIVVRNPENRARLQKAAMDQVKVGEAPVVVIAIGMKEESLRIVEEVVHEGALRGAGKLELVGEVAMQARNFLSSIPMEVWVNRHTMIAVTTMMLVAEAFGLDTAPMEGFDPSAVKQEFAIPDEAEVVALLAIGHMREPDKAYPGRFPLSQIAFEEQYGNPWNEPQPR